MKKKTLSLFLALVLSLSLLAGCGGGDEPGNQPSDNKEPSTAQQPSDSQPADDQPSDSGKQYDGVNLTMWSMWNSDEPRARSSRRPWLLSRSRPAPRSAWSGRAAPSTKFSPLPWSPARSLTSLRTTISVSPTSIRTLPTT